MQNRAASKRRSILVVEDDADIRELLIEQLEQAGYLVAAVGSGVDALARLKAGAVTDLIVLDLALPQMDGWEFRLEQRRDPELAHIPVIAMSADGTAKAAAVDADAFFPKPFDVKALIGEIERMLNLLDRERVRGARLGQTERLASLGMLAAGVGHEINNPLAYVLGNLELALTEMDKAAASPAALREVREALCEAKGGAEQIRRIVRDLRTFSRTGPERREAVDLRRALELAINMSWNELRHRGRLVKVLGDAPLVEADESRLGQVFVNLLVNAAHALDERNIERNVVRLELGKDARGWAVVEVHDNGRGIADADLPRLFEPFFTTRAEEGGTGLGLAMAMETVRRYGGEIQVQSTVRVGSVFRVFLAPWTSRAVTPQPSTAPPPTATPPRGRVLIVEDDPSLVRLIQRTVCREHDSLVASSAQAALDLLAQDDVFDVILCDLMMPGMTGMDLYRRVKERSPLVAQRFAFMTGGAFSPGAQKFLDEVEVPRFEKPFDHNNVRALIHERVAARLRLKPLAR